MDFVSDVEFPNQYYASCVRAKHIGKVVNIELPPLPEDVFFISAKDIKGKNIIQLFNRTMPIFADEMIDYEGEVVGLIIGVDEKETRRIANEVNVLVEGNETPIELVFNSETIEEIEEKYSSRIISKLCKEEGDVSEYFKEEENIVTSFLHVDARSHYHAEPICIKARAKQNSLDVYVATQWAFHVQESICQAIGENPAKVKIISCNESYSLNGRLWYPSLLATQVAIASYTLKKNIALNFSFRESFVYSTASPIIAIKHKSKILPTENSSQKNKMEGLQANETEIITQEEQNSIGKIAAIDVLCVVDAGAFNLLLDAILTQIVITALGVYGIPIYRIKVIAIKTNTRLTDVFSNWGDHYTNTAIEKHISDIVDKYNFDPIDFRLDNMLKMQTKTVVAKKEENKVFALINSVCQASSFNRKYRAYKTLNEEKDLSYNNYCRGIGIAIGVQYNGLKPIIKRGVEYTVEITLTTNQELLIKAEPSSNLMKELLKLRILKILNIEKDKIIFENIKNISLNDIGPSMSSCSTSILPILVDKCVQDIQKQRFREPLPITVKKTYKVSGRSGWDNEKLEGQPFICETPGCCVVELELDKSTYNVNIRSIYMAVEVGDVFSKEYLISSINRSITDTLSGIYVEKMPSVYNRTSDYSIISPIEIPNIEVILQNSNTSQVRGVANLPCNLLPAAYMSALNQIIKSENLSLLPITQQNLFGIFEKRDIDGCKL
ncbi:MAG: molybdopterin cofactor-binding domain-containing protein [Treponema sp.]